MNYTMFRRVAFKTIGKISQKLNVNATKGYAVDIHTLPPKMQASFHIYLWVLFFQFFSCTFSKLGFMALHRINS